MLYDDLDPDRWDREAYLAIVDEVGARTVVDIGCGTGTLALMLARRGISAVGVDPATASLDVARGKPGAADVTWVEGDATALAGPGLRFDLALMIGNVAQVFVDDDDWRATLGAVQAVVRPGGWFAFETRRPEARAWEGWELSETVDLPDGRTVVLSRTVTEVSLPLVTFESTTDIDGELLLSRSTLRFRERAEIEADLEAHGFHVVEVREAPDRPGLELVFLARRGDA